MKNWLKIAAALVIGAFVFTSCGEDEVILTVPGDITLDLGASFDPMTGVSVDGAKLSDVEWNVVPGWNIYEVNHYEFTYSVEDQTQDRNVYIKADRLAGTYAVTDTDTGADPQNAYALLVLTGTEYNTLRFENYIFDNIGFVNAVINGSVLTIPLQQFGNGTSIQGTGTYNGETGKILMINYTCTHPQGDFTGVSIFE